MPNPPASSTLPLSQIPSWGEVESDPQFVAADKPTQLAAFNNWRNMLLDASLKDENAFTREDFDRFQVFSRRKAAELSGSPTWQQDADRSVEQYRAEEESRQKLLQDSLSRKPLAPLTDATTLGFDLAQAAASPAAGAIAQLATLGLDLAQAAASPAAGATAQLPGVVEGLIAAPEEKERDTLRKVFQDEEDFAIFNGRFVASPSLVLDRDKYKKAVAESSLDRDAKIRAMAELGELRDQVAASVSDNMLKTESTYGEGLIGIGNDFTKMRDYELSRNPQATEADIVEKWRKQNDHWWKNPMKQTFLGARMAGTSLVQQYYGLKSLAGLADEMDENRLTAATQQLGELGEASKNIGGATLASQASSQVLQMAPLVALGPVGRGAGALVSGAAARTAARAGFALTGRAASSLASGAASRVGLQLPRIRALLAEKQTAGQIAKTLGLAEAEVAPVAKMLLREQAIHSAGGQAAVVLASGLQAAGSSYPEIRDQVLSDLSSTLDKEDPEYEAKLAQAEKTAVDTATYQALRRGFVTMAVTWAGNKLGGDTGEAALAGSGTLRGVSRGTAKALKDNFAVYLFKTAGKEVVPEAIEEASDSLVNGLVDKMTYDPNRSIGDIASDVFESGAWGGFLGGFFGGVKAAANYSAEKQAALRAKPVADLLSASKGLEETGSPQTAAELRKQAGELAERTAAARLAAGLAPVEEAPPTSGVSFPMTVTRDMRQQLADLGYTQADINQLTPQAATDLIQSGLRKPPVVETAAPAEAPPPAPAPRAATRPGEAPTAAAPTPVAEATPPAPAPRAATRPAEAPAPAAPPASGVGLFVTKDMNRQLAELGYTQADIAQFTPEVANNLIQGGLRKPAAAAAPPAEEAPVEAPVEAPAPAPEPKVFEEPPVPEGRVRYYRFGEALPGEAALTRERPNNPAIPVSYTDVRIEDIAALFGEETPATLSERDFGENLQPLPLAAAPAPAPAPEAVTPATPKFSEEALTTSPVPETPPANITAEALPSIPEGMIRLTHGTSGQSIRAILQSGRFDYSKQGVIDATTDSFGNNQDLAERLNTSVAGPMSREKFGDKVLIMDIPLDEYRRLRSVTAENPGFVPANRIVAIYDSNSKQVFTPELPQTPASAATPVAAETPTQTPTPTTPDASIQRNIPENRQQERVQDDEGRQAAETGGGNRPLVSGQVEGQAQGQAENVTPAATPGVGVTAPTPAKSPEQALRDKAAELRNRLNSLDPENTVSDSEYEALTDELMSVEADLQAIEDAKSPAPEAEAQKTLTEVVAPPARKAAKAKAGDPIKKVEKLVKAQKGRPISKSKLSLIETVLGGGAVNIFNTRAEAEAFVGQTLPPGKYGATVPTQDGVVIVLFADELAEEGSPAVRDVLFHEGVHFAEELLLRSDPEARKLYADALPVVRDAGLIKVMEEIYPGFGAITSDDVRMAEVVQAIIEGKLTSDLVSLTAPQKTGFSKWIKALLKFIRGLVGARPALLEYTNALEHFLGGFNTQKMAQLITQLEGTQAAVVRPPMFAARQAPPPRPRPSPETAARVADLQRSLLQVQKALEDPQIKPNERRMFEQAKQTLTQDIANLSRVNAVSAPLSEVDLAAELATEATDVPVDENVTPPDWTYEGDTRPETLRKIDAYVVPNFVKDTVDRGLVQWGWEDGRPVIRVNKARLRDKIRKQREAAAAKLGISKQELDTLNLSVDISRHLSFANAVMSRIQEEYQARFPAEEDTPTSLWTGGRVEGDSTKFVRGDPSKIEKAKDRDKLYSEGLFPSINRLIPQEVAQPARAEGELSSKDKAKLEEASYWPFATKAEFEKEQALRQAAAATKNKKAAAKLRSEAAQVLADNKSRRFSVVTSGLGKGSVPLNSALEKSPVHSLPEGTKLYRVLSYNEQAPRRNDKAGDYYALRTEGTNQVMPAQHVTTDLAEAKAHAALVGGAVMEVRSAQVRKVGDNLIVPGGTFEVVQRSGDTFIIQQLEGAPRVIVQGFFTNVPEVTAMQISKGYSVFIPPEVGDAVHPHIEYDPNTRLVKNVKVAALGADAEVSIEDGPDAYAQLWNDRRPIGQRSADIAEQLSALEQEYGMSLTEAKDQLYAVTRRVQSLQREGNQLKNLDDAKQEQLRLLKIVRKMEKQFATTVWAERPESVVPVPENIKDPAELEQFAAEEAAQYQRAVEYMSENEADLIARHADLAGIIASGRLQNAVVQTVINTFRKKQGVGSINLDLVTRGVVRSFYRMLRRADPFGGDAVLMSLDAPVDGSTGELLAGSVAAPEALDAEEEPLTNDEKSLLGIALSERVLDGDPDRTLRVLSRNGASNEELATARQILDLHRRGAAFTVASQTGEVTLTYGPELTEVEMEQVSRLLPKVNSLGFSGQTARKFPNLARILVRLHEETVTALLEITQKPSGNPLYSAGEINQMSLEEMVTIAKNTSGTGMLEHLDIVRYQIATLSGIESPFLAPTVEGLPTAQEALAQIQEDLRRPDLSPEYRQRLEQERETLTQTIENAKTLQAARLRAQRGAERLVFDSIRENLRALLGPMFDMPANPAAPRFSVEALQRFREELERFGVDTTNWRNDNDSSMQMSAQSLTRLLSYFSNRAKNRTEAAKSFQPSVRREPLDMARYTAAIEAGIDPDTAYQQARIPLLAPPTQAAVEVKDGAIASMLAELLEKVRESYSFEVVVSAVANGNTSTPVAWKGNQLIVDLNAFPEGDSPRIMEAFAKHVQQAMLQRMTQEALNRALGSAVEGGIGQALETLGRGEGVHPTLVALEELRMEAVKLFGDMFPKETQNVREFVMGLYTNPSFVRALNEQKAAGGTGFKGLLSRVSRFIAQLLMDFLNPAAKIKVNLGSVYHTAVVESLRLMSLSPSNGVKTAALLNKLFFVPESGTPVAAAVIKATSPAIAAAKNETNEDVSDPDDKTLEQTVEEVTNDEVPVSGPQTSSPGTNPNASVVLKPAGSPPALPAQRAAALGLVTSILEEVDSNTPLQATVAPEGTGLTLWVTGNRDSNVIHVDVNNLAQVVTEWRTAGMSEADIKRRLRAGLEEEVDHLEIHRRFSDTDLIRIGLGMDPAERRNLARSIAGPDASPEEVARAAGDGPNMTPLEQAKAMAILADEYLRRTRQRVRSGFTTEDVRAITKTEPRSLNRVLAYLTAYFRRVAARWNASADPVSLRAALNTASFLSANGMTVDQITGGIPDIAERLIATAAASTAYGDARFGTAQRTKKDLESGMFDGAAKDVREAMEALADMEVDYDSLTEPELIKRAGDLVEKHTVSGPMTGDDMKALTAKIRDDVSEPERVRHVAKNIVLKMTTQAAIKATDPDVKGNFRAAEAAILVEVTKEASAFGANLRSVQTAQDKILDPHRAVATYGTSFIRGTKATLKTMGVDKVVEEIERELGDPAKISGGVVDGVVGEDVRKASVKAKAKKKGVSDKDIAEAEQDEAELADAQRRRPRDELAEAVAEVMVKRVAKRLQGRIPPADKGAFDDWFKRVQAEVSRQVSAKLSDGSPDNEKVPNTVWSRFMQNAEDADILRQAFDSSMADIRRQLAPGGDPNFNGPPTQEQVDKLTRTLALLEGARAEVLPMKDAAQLVRQSFRFREEVKAHVSDQLASVASLTKMLVEVGELDETQAKLVAKYIEIAYEEEKAKYIQKLIERYKRSDLAASAATVVDKLSRSEELAQFARMGAFRSEEFYSAIARSLELPTYDTKVVEQLEADLAAINAMPKDSIQRLDAGRELSSKVADLILKQLVSSNSLKGLLQKHPEVLWTYLVEVPTSMWKAGILSGFGTQQVNLVFGSLQSIMDLTNNAVGYAMTAPKGNRASLMARNLFTIFKSALLLDPATRAETITEMKRALFTGSTRFQSEQTESLSRLERDLPLVGKITKPYSLLGRVMMVIDALVGVPANMARQRMAIAHLATKQGYDADQMRELLSKAFSPEETVMRQIENQLDGEASSFALSKNPALMREARRNELLEQYRDSLAKNLSAGADIITEGRISANVANLSSQPKGFAGWVMDGIFGSLERKTRGATSLLVPFARSLANMLDFSLAMSFFPVSFLRAYNMSPSSWMPDSMISETYRRQQVERGSQEFYKLMSQGFMSTFLTAGLAMAVFEMFRAMADDEEPFIAAYGDGPADAEKRNQLRLRAPFWKPNVLKIGSFYANWKDLPGINLLLGGIAALSDSVINAQEKGRRVRPSQFAVNSMIQLTRAMFAKQPLQGLEDASKLLFGRAEGGASLDKVLMKMASSWVGGVTNPRILRDVEDMTRGLLSETGETPMIETAKTWSDALQSVLPGSSLLFDRPAILNARGKEVTSFWFAPFTKRLLPDMESPHTDEIITPLVSAGLYLSPPESQMAFKTWKDPEDRAAGIDPDGAILSSFDSDVAREALILYGEQMTAMLQSGNVINNLVRFAERGQVEREAAQKALDSISSAARKYAQSKLQRRILDGELLPHWQQ